MEIGTKYMHLAWVAKNNKHIHVHVLVQGAYEPPKVVKERATTVYTWVPLKLQI